MGFARKKKLAYGRPGYKTHWSTGAKDGVGTALDPAARLWFTLGHGIINEVYYPRIDTPSLRELGFIISDGKEFFSEEKKDAESEVRMLEPGLPNFVITSRCKQGRYILKKRVTADPERPALLQEYQLQGPQGASPLTLYALVTPHLANQLEHNSAWVDEWRGRTVAFAAFGETCLALISEANMEVASVGYVGASDGWQILCREKRLQPVFDDAPDGSVAITIQLPKNKGTLALGFGQSPNEAAIQAEKALQQGFSKAWQRQSRSWRHWLKGLQSAPQSGNASLWFSSCMVLKSHMSKTNPGGIVASLAIPWGETRSDDALAGYHLIWPRDLCEAAGGLLAAGALDEAEAVLRTLQRTQQDDGHWSQNMWVDGRPWWNNIQMDETSSPILLVHAIRQRLNWTTRQLQEFWPMLKRAAAYILRNGPVTPQGRWQNQPGYSLYTLAAEIAALHLAGNIAAELGYADISGYLQETADWWNASLERWVYVQDTALARELGVGGYYADIISSGAEARGKNSGPGNLALAGEAKVQISPDVLALVRFGLRAADDPRILSSVKALDAMLRCETPFGPCWYRYKGDKYGEKADGSPFDGSGQGRLWPLLTGERAHYELAAGRPEEARRLAQTMAAFSSSTLLLPEQVWDQDDKPEFGLYKGRPTGSAMPLVWAHAEYMKLCRSLDEGRVFDLPALLKKHFQNKERKSVLPIWSFQNKILKLAHCNRLRIETMAPALVHWSHDHWVHSHDSQTRDTDLSVHVVDIPIKPSTRSVIFTFYWPESGHWEGRDFEVEVEGHEREGKVP